MCDMKGRRESGVDNVDIPLTRAQRSKMTLGCNWNLSTRRPHMSGDIEGFV